MKKKVQKKTNNSPYSHDYSEYAKLSISLRGYDLIERQTSTKRYKFEVYEKYCNNKEMLRLISRRKSTLYFYRPNDRIK